MAAANLICLFSLPPYDKQVAPALRQYERNSDPGGVVALLKQIIATGGRMVLERQDYEHWIDSIEPDKGHKPTERTVKELADMLIEQLCIPQKQQIDALAPWLSQRSDWFSDLMDGGEELAGGRLEFTFGTGALIATRQQIAQFLNELKQVGPPDGARAGLLNDYLNLRKLLEAANRSTAYTLAEDVYGASPGGGAFGLTRCPPRAGGTQPSFDGPFWKNFASLLSLCPL